MDESPLKAFLDSMPSIVRSSLEQLGKLIESQIDESEVDRIMLEVFPVDFPGRDDDKLRLLIRIAISNRETAKRFGIPFETAWKGLEWGIINPAARGEMRDHYDVETLAAVCSRLKKAVYGE
jgi:hypothetical protein